MARENSTAVDYLRNYYSFEDDVLDCVEHAAYNQEDLTWPEFVRRYDIPEPKMFHPSRGYPIEVVDIVPTDYERVVMYHMPMGCQLDSNMMTHVVTMAHSMPSNRIISVGNPSGPGQSSGKLSINESWQVLNGDLRPAVGPTLEYLSKKGIEEAVHIGESYGAEKTAAAAQYASQYDHRVTDGVMTEPVSTDGFIKTGLAFMQTAKYGDKYLKPVRELSDAFRSAEALRGSQYSWMLGLGRLSNLAIGYALGAREFEHRLETGLQQNPNMVATVAWGTESELALNGITRHLTDNLRSRFGERVQPMPLEGQTHAMNLDVFLNAAIVLQALKNHQTAE